MFNCKALPAPRTLPWSQWYAASLILGLIACAQVAALAQADHSTGILDPQAVLEAARKVTRERYPNADDVLLDDYILVRYEADGRAVTWDDTFVKVLTEKGKEDNAELTQHFTLPYNQARFTLVQVIKPDGTILPVDLAKQSKVMVDRSQMSSNIFDPNSKVLRVGVPNVEVGDIVRYVALDELVKPRVPDTWSDYQIFEYMSPIKHYVYEVQAPKDLPLRSIALKSEVAGTVTHTREEKGDRLHYRWELRDVPRMYQEPKMPAFHTVVQRLLVSTIPSWSDLSQWYWNLSAPHLDATPEMKAKVAELTKGIDDREPKIRALFKFVSQDVRYMGITVEKEAPGYEPHDVRLTFDNLHGVCRDKAALLVSMLRLADIKAFPVLINAGPKKDEEVPQPYFNHAVTAAENPDGSYTLMDSTDENTAQLFPAYLSNMSYLVAKPDGETLKTSPIVPAEENLLRVDTKASINAAGDLTGESVLHFDGINDNAYRGYFAQITPQERRRYFEGVLKRIAAGTRIRSLDIQPADMRDTETPLTIRLAYEAKDALVANDSTVMVPVPRIGTQVGMVNFILRETGLDKRKYPLQTDFACGVRESLRVALDPSLGKVAAMPTYPKLESDTLRWQRDLHQEGDALVGRNEFLIQTVEFDPDQYLALKEALKTIEVNDRKKPILTREATGDAGTSEVDVLVLEDTWEYDVKEARNWLERHTIKERVLTQKGKKDHAEWQWDYNPAWEEVKLLKATVTNGDDVKAVSKEEINLMDAGWAASAPRYPTAKTLVASLPGVEVGSVIEVQVETAYRDHPFFWMRHSFREYDPIRRRTVKLSAPKSMKLLVDVAQTGFGNDATEAEPALRETKSERGGRVLYEWTAENQSPVARERDLPPWWSFTPTVWVTAGEWAEYGREVRAALLKAAQGQPHVESVAAELATKAATSEVKAISIRDHVAKRIRSAGPTVDDLPLTAITPADQTYADAYGNSADRAVVLYAMLAKAGFEPQFVLASLWTAIDAHLPAVSRHPRTTTLPHVLVRVNVDGETIYLNDSSQYSALGATSHDGCFALNLRDGRLLTLAAAPGMRDTADIVYYLRLTEDGEAEITKKVYYHGTAFARNHRRFAEMPPEERRRYHQELLTELSQAAQADGELVTNFDRYPGEMSFKARLENFAIREGKYLYFELPDSFGGLLGIRADTRKNDLLWQTERRTRLTMTVSLPSSTSNVVLGPQPMTWTAPNGAGNVTIRTEPAGPGSFRLIQEADLKPALIDADNYSQLLEIDRRLSHTRAEMVVATSAPTASGDR